MPSAGFMFVTADGSQVRGDSSVSSQERAGSIEVVELNHEVKVPSALASGAPTGTRVHHVLRVKARVDRAVPLMYRAWANNESCEVLLRFWRPDPGGSGQEVEFFKITLTGARVAALTMHWPNMLTPGTASIPEQVEYAFTYQTINWEFLDGGIAFLDQWYAQPS